MWTWSPILLMALMGRVDLGVGLVPLALRIGRSVGAVWGIIVMGLSVFSRLRWGSQSRIKWKVSGGLGRLPRGNVSNRLREPQLGHYLVIPSLDLWRDRFHSQP
jgi:hypothetical protein